MKSDINPNRVYETAVHEASHAMMCILKCASFKEVVVRDEADEFGRLGYCAYYKPSNVNDNIWITLAGPAMSAIYTNRSLSMVFLGEGTSDFDYVFAKLSELYYPKIPAEFEAYLGSDVPSLLTLHYNGWRPEGVRGKLKRSITLFTKRCVEADSLVADLVHFEAMDVMRFIRDTVGLQQLIMFLADRLYERRRMSCEDVLQVVREFADTYEGRQSAAA